MYVQMSLIWSAGHPLHQAVSHFFCSFLFVFTKNKRKTQEKEAEQKKENRTKKIFRKGGKHFSETK